MDEGVGKATTDERKKRRSHQDPVRAGGEPEGRRPFQEVAREQLPRLYGLAQRLGADDPEDLVQEGLMRAFRSYGTLRSPKAAPGWFSSILVNAYRDRLRKDARQVPEVSLDGLDEFSLYRQIAEEDPFPYSDALHQDFLGLFEAEDVHRVLATLPPHYRGALVLRYIEGHPTKYVARSLGLPLGTVLAQLHRGRKAFERALWDYAERTGLLDKETAR
ncbi:MAG TPA: sigma-70 family RNA polymerase sigma factor [Actinomycetota bacterium]|nr:sigma-70 family RNA polymerase sigma factor [Actinomycetota bacterium]